MSVDFPLSHAARSPGAALSWAAVLAALAVGIAVQLLLTLIGFAVGLYAGGSVGDADSVTLAAALWGTASMLIAAFVGGYVAARASSLRRASDGVLHGVVAWATTTLLYAALATTAIGQLTTGLFSLLGSAGADTEATAAATDADEDRERAVQMLGEFGVSRDQALRVIEPLTGSTGEERVETLGSATLWLAGAVLMSLIVTMFGGWLGARGARRVRKTVIRDV